MCMLSADHAALSVYGSKLHVLGEFLFTAAWTLVLVLGDNLWYATKLGADFGGSSMA